MNIKDIRLARLQLLLDEHDGVKRALADTIKKKPAQVSQWFNHVRTIEEETAREIERAAKRPRGWMDIPPLALHTGDSSVRPLVAEEAPTKHEWPFPRLDPLKVGRLKRHQIHDLETAMLVVAAQLGVNIAKRRAA